MAAHRPNRVMSSEALEPRLLLATISFEPLAKYTAGMGARAGAGPHLVAVGDFTGDGIQDVVAAGDTRTVTPVQLHYVRVLPGRGDGTFGPFTGTTPAGDRLTGIVAADFNGDGRLDVAVSDDSRQMGQGRVTVLPGNGDGTFGRGRTYFSGAASTDLAAADFNRDGALDLVVSNANPWTPEFSLAPPVHGAALLLGNGDGTFQSARLQPTRGPQHFVEAGNVNDDRLPDAVFGQVVIGPGDFAAPLSRVFAMLGGGPDLLQPPGAAADVPAAITGMELADLNGDGRTDVAVSTMTDFLRPGAGGAAGVVPGNGDGTFGAAALYPVGMPVTHDVAVADYNADGLPDLAVSASNPLSMAPFDVGAVVALPNTGRGTFGESAHFGFVGYPAGLAAGHFNRDRLPDLVTAIPREDVVGVLVNNTATFSVRGLPVTATAGQAITDAQVARFTLTGPVKPAAGSYTATILWGDGTARTPGTVVANSDGTYSVLGTHTYRRAGTYRIIVVLRGQDGSTRLASSLARVTRPAVA